MTSSPPPGEEPTDPWSLIPTPESDAFTQDIPAQPHPGEFGALSLGRDLTRELSLRLPPPLTTALYRENPWDRRPCPQAQFYDITISGHQIRITGYQAEYPLSHDTHTVFAITLDGQPVPFERARVDPLPPQIAYAVWSAHLDLPEHTHPISSPNTTTSPGSVEPS